MFSYKKKRCYIKPVGKLFIGLSHYAPGVPYVQKYTVDGPGYVAWSPGIGKAFARKAKDARKLLQEAIDNQPQVIVVQAKAVFTVNGVYRG
jgi:pyruvate/2-oxoglutarate/acetoin dehydrogenase E1 component